MPQKRKILRLGTRASMLAMAQSRQVAERLEQLHENLQVDLIEIATSGDRDLSTPLTAVNDPHFFSAQLDQALLSGTVDFCVHSYKDLAQPRPVGLQIAALPARENPADVIVFRADIDRLLKDGQSIRIGSSSRRRQTNCGDFLPAALPQFQGKPTIEFHALRGGVTDRLQRITQAAGAQRLDGVVLALAGLQRLWSDPAGREAIAETLNQARWMVLPLSECPTAPGQGALALECKTASSETLEILRSIHDPETETMLRVEQDMLDECLLNSGATDSSSIGVTAIPNRELGYVARLRGRDAESAHTAAACQTAGQPGKPAVARPWSDTDRRRSKRKPLKIQLPDEGATFVAHWHAMEGHTLNSRVRCWTSGTSSWKQLAKQGIWVEGCADHLGFATLQSFLQLSVLKLPMLKKWTALTHVDALASWRDSGVGVVIATYRNAPEDAKPEEFKSATAIADSTHFYWLSPQQFHSMQPLLPRKAHHSCGPGKTLTALREAGLKDIATFPSQKEWQQWLS